MLPLTLDGTSAFDRRGYPRAPVGYPGFRKGQKPPNYGRTFPPEPLTSSEVYALIDACADTPTGRRNAMIVKMFWRTGLRCSELIALLPKDVDLDRGAVTVLHGKGDKRRVVAIDPEAGDWFSVWEGERRELGLTRLQPYFPVLIGPTRGLALGDAYIREFMKQLGRRAGVEKRVHPHCLRHSYASWLLDMDVPIHYIQRCLGHTSIAVTQRYADHVNPARVLREIRKVEWPARHAA